MAIISHGERPSIKKFTTLALTSGAMEATTLLQNTAHRVSLAIMGLLTTRPKWTPRTMLPQLTGDQIRQIYTADITNWKDVGGNDATISPYIRDANSGSQEKMETLVMNGLTMIDWPHMRGFSMLDPFFQVSSDDNGIGYTLYYFANVMALGERCGGNQREYHQWFLSIYY